MLAKSNIGPDKGGYEYELWQSPLYSNPDIIASVVSWGERIEGSARDILAEAETVKPEDEGKAASLREAEDFLVDLLADGPLPAKDVAAAARAAKQGWRTVERAKAKLKIRTGRKRDDYPWSLPQDQVRQEEKSPLDTLGLANLADIDEVKQNQEVQLRQELRQPKNLADLVGGPQTVQNQEVNLTPPTPPAPPRCGEGDLQQTPDDTVEVEL
jgi:hypothetical protein